MSNLEILVKLAAELCACQSIRPLQAHTHYSEERAALGHMWRLVTLIGTRLLIWARVWLQLAPDG